MSNISQFTSIESLENRRFFSVSDSIFAGSLATGSKADYEVFSSGKLLGNQDGQVVGPATFNGHSATRLKSTFLPKGSTIPTTTTNYYATLGSLGFEAFGETMTTTSYTSNLYFSPEEIEFPASVVAGKTYKSTYIDKTIQTIGGHSTTSYLTIILEVKLVNASPTVSITVPAGTFKCYQLDQVTYAGSPTPSTLTAYYAPNVGLVESISPAPGNGEIELTSYHNA
jgi:hypothetical protein